jgi:hypothetical protein
MSYPIDFATRALGIRQPITPVRIRKLYRSTWINCTRFRELNYEWTFTLESAFQDWKKDSPDDFAR